MEEQERALMVGHGFRVDLLNPRAADDWYRYVEPHPDATLFHGLAWKRAVERAFGHRSWYLMARREERVVGVLPLFEINSLLAGRFLVSVPYATYGGILADGRDVAVALFKRAKEIAAQVGACSIELRSIEAAVPSVDIRNSHATFRKELPARSADVAASFPRKARAAARRASERFNLSVTFDRRDLSMAWKLYARSMHRLGSVNYPLEFFEELASALGDRCLVQMVRREGRPVAGLVTFLHRDTVMPYFAGVDERCGIYGLNQFMYTESMRWAVEHGYRRYDFGRSRIDNEGCFNFKRLCGFEPQVLQFQVHAMPGHQAPDLAPSSPRWATARRVWKSLPLPVTRPLGSWLAKSIPG